MRADPKDLVLAMILRVGTRSLTPNPCALPIHAKRGVNGARNRARIDGVRDDGSRAETDNQRGDGKSGGAYFFRLRVRLALMKECTVKYKQTTVKIPSIVAR